MDWEKEEIRNQYFHHSVIPCRQAGIIPIFHHSTIPHSIFPLILSPTMPNLL
jgi:hypothetical protein